MDSLRLFIAIELSPDTVNALFSIQNELAQGRNLPGIRWVSKENMHLTLQFLGDTHPNLIPQIKTSMDQCAQKQKSFTLHMDGLGFFPTGKNTKVVWSGVREVQKVNALAASLRAELGPRFPAIGKFSPHITLARVSDRATDDCVATLIQSVENIADGRQFGVSKIAEICLFQSQLSYAGPKYTKLYSSPLSNR